MAKNIFDGVFDEIHFPGTNHLGKGMAQAAAVGAADTSVMTSEKTVAEVAATKSADSPVIGLENRKYAVPRSVRPSETVRLGWNTAGEDDAIVKIMLLDPKGLAEAAGLTEDGITTGGQPYSGSNTVQGQKQYAAIMNLLCNKEYLFTSIRITAKRTDGSEVAPNFDDLVLKFVPVNEAFDPGQVTTINVVDHIDPNQRHRDMVDISLKGVAQKIDPFVTLKAIGAKNMDYKFILTTGLRF